MRAAVARRTADGEIVGEHETLSPEQSLALFLTPLDDPGGTPRRIEVGALADFCVLARPWQQARTSLSAALVATSVNSR